jgi:transglutaminase-like putative cysteine protease
LLLAILTSPFVATTETWAVEPAAIRPDLPYQAIRVDPIQHEVDFSAVVTPPYHCKVLRVWLPLPQSDAAQDISDSRLMTFPMKVQPQIGVESDYGNKFAYFEFHDPQGAQVIRHRFRARVWGLHWNLDPATVVAVPQWPSSFDAYLRPQQVSDQEEFAKTVETIVPKVNDPADDLFQAMNWIDRNLTYDHVNASLQADADHAFSQRRGHCSDYHGLCATMGRSMGQPTRVTYGLALYPKNSPSHCKMEAFLPPYGWVSFDISETQKLLKKIDEDEQLSDADKAKLTEAARQRLHHGFRENSWLLVTKGTDYDLVPKAVAGPVRVVRTIYAEADGEALPEPDPANIQERKFGWMTVHKYASDKPARLPFKDVSTLR